MSDFKNHSQSDLEFVSVSVDRGKYPDRYKAVIDEIASRKAAGTWVEKSEGKVAKIMNPSEDFILKWVPRYLVVSSLASIGFLAFLVARAGISSISFFIAIVGLLWTLTGFFAGFFFTRRPKWVRTLSHIYLCPQVFNIMVAGYGFTALSGAGFGLRVVKDAENTNFGFQLDVLNFYFQLNWNQPGVPALLSVNFVALWVLIQIRKRSV